MGYDASEHAKEYEMTIDERPDLPAEPPQSTVYFDGSCPLCQAEIGYYRGIDRAGAICFVDVSKAGAVTPEGVTQQGAIARFHVRSADGRILSGAAAFVEVWTRLPRWRWAARVAKVPGVLPVLELGYRAFLPVRPYLSRLAGRLSRPKA
jgi:predicted DCC family thiol-disulfide oxidoreductase YuxK